MFMLFVEFAACCVIIIFVPPPTFIPARNQIDQQLNMDLYSLPTNLSSYMKQEIHTECYNILGSGHLGS